MVAAGPVVRRSVWVIASLCLLQAPVQAQDRLILGTHEVAASGAGFGTTVGPAGGLGGELAGGGRFGLLYDHLIDRSTGRRVNYPFPSISFLVAADPARPRGFFARARPLTLGEVDSIVAADLTSGVITTLVPVTSPPGTQAPTTAHFAVDANRLFVSRPGADAAVSEFVAVDPDVGASSLRVLPLPPVAPYYGASWAVTPDGTRLYRVEGAGPNASIAAYDPETGAETGRVLVPQPGFSPALRWNDVLDGLIVETLPGAQTVFTLLTRDLATAGSLGVATWGKCGPAKLAISAVSGRIYTFTGDGNYYSVPFPSRLAALTLSRGTVDETDRVADEIKVNCTSMRVASAPGAPRRLVAQAAGRDVSLRWENVGGASRFLLEVGFGPGRTDLRIPLGPDSHAGFAQVPPGTYYLRLRGENTFGRGMASNEVPLVIP